VDTLNLKTSIQPVARDGELRFFNDHWEGLNMIRMKTIMMAVLGLAAVAAFAGKGPGRRLPIEAGIVREHQRIQMLQTSRPGAELKNGSVPDCGDCPTGSIAGTVRGLDADGAASASITAWSEDSTAYPWGKGCAVIDPVTSRYQIDGLAPGLYYLAFYADGYEPQYYDGVSSLEKAAQVPVSANTVTESVYFTAVKTVPHTGRITGRVLTRKDLTPVPQASVYAWDPNNWLSPGAGAATLEDGSYELTGLAAGSYYVQVWTDGFLFQYWRETSSYEEAEVVPLEESGVAEGIDFYLSRGGVITGTVTNDSGFAVSGASINVYTVVYDSVFPGPDGGEDLKPQFSQWYWGSSGEDGRYTVSGLEPGTYYASAYAYNPAGVETMQWFDHAADAASATPIEVAAESETGGVDFTLHFPASNAGLAGLVTDSKGRPLKGAGISLYMPEDYPWRSSPVYSAVTDSAGEYRLDRLMAGKYIASCSFWNGWESAMRFWPDAETMDQAEQIPLAEGEVKTGIDFRLPVSFSMARVSGHVTNSDGHPLAGAYIEFSLGGTDGRGAAERLWIAYSDSSGYYESGYLPEGTYFFHCQYWDAEFRGDQWYDGAEDQSSATPVVLQTDEIRDDIDFSLNLRSVYGSIAGRITDSKTGAGLYPAYVEVRATYWDDIMSFAPIFWRPYHAFADADGNYRLDQLPEADYTVYVYTQGGFACWPDGVIPEQAGKIPVVGGEVASADVNVKLRDEGSGIIRGKVVEADWVGWDKDSTVTDDSTVVVEPRPFPKTGDGIKYAVVMARPAVTLMVWPESNMFFTTLSDSTGGYEVQGLPAGDYIVSSFAAERMLQYYDNSYDPSNAEIVKVDGVIAAEGIDFSLYPDRVDWWRNDPEKDMTNPISGTVRDASGNPVPNALVYLLDEGGRPVSSVQTDAQGNYALPVSTNGDYLLQASCVGYSAAFNGGAPNLDEALPFNYSGQSLRIDLILESGSHAEQPEPSIPNTLVLLGNYPNPFNPETEIRFSLPQRMEVMVRIYNMAGQEIEVIHQGMLDAGERSVRWRAESAPSGIYIYRIETPGSVMNGKMTLLR
jgi:protocatechuate 3,4-dioxygenase beta subunit